MTYISKIPYTTFDHPSMTTESRVTEHNAPTLHYLLTLMSGTRPHHPALTFNKDFYIPQTFNRQVKIMDELLAPLNDEELRALAMMRGFEKYVGVVHTYHLYLVEAFLNACDFA